MFGQDKEKKDKKDNHSPREKANNHRERKDSFSPRDKEKDESKRGWRLGSKDSKNEKSPRENGKGIGEKKDKEKGSLILGNFKENVTDLFGRNNATKVYS